MNSGCTGSSRNGKERKVICIALGVVEVAYRDYTRSFFVCLQGRF